MRRGELRPQPEGFLKFAHCLVQIALPEVETSQRIVRLRVAGLLVKRGPQVSFTDIPVPLQNR